MIWVTDAFVEERRHNEHQLQIRQLQVRAATDEPVCLTAIRCEHAAAADQVVDELPRFVGGEQGVVEGVEPDQGDVAQQLTETLGVNFNTIIANARTDALLEESQRLTSELQARSEELQDQQRVDQLIEMTHRR